MVEEGAHVDRRDAICGRTDPTPQTRANTSGFDTNSSLGVL